MLTVTDAESHNLSPYGECRFA